MGVVGDQIAPTIPNIRDGQGRISKHYLLSRDVPLMDLVALDGMGGCNNRRSDESFGVIGPGCLPALQLGRTPSLCFECPVGRSHDGRSRRVSSEAAGKNSI